MNLLRYVHGKGPLPAEIMLVGEAPGVEENDRGEPFVGPAGYYLDKMLGEAGISRPSIRVTNAFRRRPSTFDNNIRRLVTFVKKQGIERKWPYIFGAYINPDVIQHIDDLHREVISTDPNIIIAMGGTAYWALTGEPPRKYFSLTDIRGNIFHKQVNRSNRKYKIIPTYHASYIMQYAPQDRPIVVHDLSRALRESTSSDLIERDTTYWIRPTFDQVMTFLDKMYWRIELEDPWLTIDSETRGQLACMGIGHRTEAMCIPLMQLGEDQNYWPIEHETAIVVGLRRLILNDKVKIRGQNLLYDCQYMAREWGIIPRIAQDTIINHHCLWPNPNMLNRLEFQATLYTSQPRYWKIEGKEWEDKNNPDENWNYNCQDVSYTHEIGDSLIQITDHMGMTKQNEFLQSLFHPVLEMMLRGVRIDLNRKEQLAKEFPERMQALQDKIDYVVGYPLNIRSNPQMCKFFYEEMGIKEVKKRTKDPDGNTVHRITADDEALEKIKTYEPLVKPVIEWIQQLRSLAVVHANVLSKPISEDGRCRCSYRIDGTSTLRFSSKEDAFGKSFNLQNITSGEDSESRPMPRGLPNIRDMFLPDPNHTIWDLDLVGADAQVVAWECDDPWMKEIFRSGADIHIETARELRITRPLAKRYRHAVHYGTTAAGIAAKVGVLTDEADQYMKRIFMISPNILKWHQRMSALCDNPGRSRIVNAFGFHYPILERNFFTHALAWIPQSTIAITINHILLNIWRHLHNHTELLLQVHDSLVGQYPTDMESEVLPMIFNETKIIIPYEDPLIIPCGLKTSTVSWGECA